MHCVSETSTKAGMSTRNLRPLFVLSFIAFSDHHKTSWNFGQNKSLLTEFDVKIPAGYTQPTSSLSSLSHLSCPCLTCLPGPWGVRVLVAVAVNHLSNTIPVVKLTLVNLGGCSVTVWLCLQGGCRFLFCFHQYKQQHRITASSSQLRQTGQLIGPQPAQLTELTS